MARACSGRGDRVLVESPTYPNAIERIRDTRAPGSRRRTGRPGRLGPRRRSRPTLRQVAPRLAYLIPDFHNPTGHADERRAAASGTPRTCAAGTPSRSSTSRQSRWPSTGRQMPRAVRGVRARTRSRVGSASKAFWGGLRIGWIRAPHGRMERLIRARLSLDLGAPVLEQLVLRPAARRRRRRSLDRHRATSCATRATRLVAAVARRPARLALPGARPAGSTCGASCPAAAVLGAAGREAERHDVHARAGPGASPPRAASTGSSGCPTPSPRRRARSTRSPGWPRPGARRSRTRRSSAGGRATSRTERRPRDGRPVEPRLLGEVDAAHRRRRRWRSRISSSSVGRDRGVDRQRDQGLTALGVAGDLHAGDVDAGVAEDLADGADHAGAVLVGEEREVLGRLEVDVEVVDLDEPLLLVRCRSGCR